MDMVDKVLDKMFAGRETINGLGMQVVVGGPEYMPEWVAEFKRLQNIPEFKGKFVYVSDSDAKLLKMQAIGADICINMPRDLEEACGTSDQRTGRNGGVNIALNGAGPAEWIRDYKSATKEGSGFLCGPYTTQTPEGPVKNDERFYREAPVDFFIKTELAAKIFYEDIEAWKQLMLNSYIDANNMVTAEKMEERYAKKVYGKAIENRRIRIERMKM